jgi:hypothetical protein
LIDLMSPLLVSVVSVVGGYYLGVVRGRNERRDAAIAEVFKEMMLFYRGILGWIDDPRPNGSPLVDPDITWKEYCWKRFDIFMDAFEGYEIWLGGNTHALIREFEHAGLEIMKEFSLPRAVNEPYEARRDEWDQLRNDLLARKLNKASDALRDEMQPTPTTFFWHLILRIVERIEKNPNR